MISKTDKKRVLRAYFDNSTMSLRHSLRFEVPQPKKFEKLPAEIWFASELYRNAVDYELCVTFTSSYDEKFTHCVSIRPESHLQI